MTNALSTLASAGILGLAVLTSTPALADVDPYCSGCGGRTIPGAIENEDMTAHFDVYETTTSGQLLNCSVEFQLFLGGYATNCEGRTSACGDSVCERTYNIKMRSLSGYGDGCDGVEVNIDDFGAAQTDPSAQLDIELRICGCRNLFLRSKNPKPVVKVVSPHGNIVLEAKVADKIV